LHTCSDGWSERREIGKQLRRFLVIGVLSVLTDLSVYVVLTRLGLSLHVAKGISYVAGMLLGFAGNKLWTFECRRPSLQEPLWYAAVYATTLAVNVAVNGVTIGLAAGLIGQRLSAGLAFFVATGVTTVLNFLGMRFLAFRAGLSERRRQAMQSASLPEEDARKTAA
jgi:putative flippase GtrA